MMARPRRIRTPEQKDKLKKNKKPTQRSLDSWMKSRVEDAIPSIGSAIVPSLSTVDKAEAATSRLVIDRQLIDDKPELAFQEAGDYHHHNPGAQRH
jgi:hypothetical protein